MSKLTLENISFKYNQSDSYLFENFSLLFDSGSIVQVSGKNGAGKSTLLKIIAGIIPRMISGYYKGCIQFQNQDLSNHTLPEISQYISMTMQDPDYQIIFPTVEQELAFGPENLLLKPEIINSRIDKYLRVLEISDLRLNETYNLSYGQKKLVTIAALLTFSPEIMLFDEPTAGLSKKYKEILSEVFLEEARNGKIIIFADHHTSFQSIINHEINL